MSQTMSFADPIAASTKAAGHVSQAVEGSLPSLGWPDDLFAGEADAWDLAADDAALPAEIAALALRYHGGSEGSRSSH